MKSKKVLLTVCWLTLVIIAHSCRKEDPPTIPVVESVIITDITQTTAIGGGQIVTDGGKPVTKRGVCWGATNQPTINENKTTDGAGDGSFVSSITGLTPGVLYYVRAYATNGVGTGYGDPVSFKTNPVVQAEITTIIISDITTNSAKSGGTIVSNGGGEITTCGVCWSLNHEPKTTDAKTTDALSGNTFTSNLSNLEYFKTYYVRAYATNSAGTVYGNEREFTTAAAPPTVTTSEVTNKSYRSATVGGEVTADGGRPVTDKGICYATHTNPKFNENNKTVGNGLGAFTVDLAGLEPNTVYHVRAYAATAADTAYGSDIEFKTLELSVSQVTTKKAEYNGGDGYIAEVTTGGEVISDGGSHVIERGICWSLNQSPTVSDKHTSDGSGLGDFTSIIYPFDLLVPAIYYVRAYARNNFGISYGNEVSVAVYHNVLIGEVNVNNITGTSAMLSVMAGPVETVRFELINKASGSVTSIFAYGGSPFSYSDWTASAIGLTVGTGYTATAHADGTSGGAISTPISFTTLNTPILTTIAASDITSNSALCGGSISSDGGSDVTERGLCWSTNENPTTSGNHISLGSGIGDFSTTINGLSPGQEYHVRAYAENSVGIAYGQDVTFSTELAPLVDIEGNSYKVVQIGSEIWMAENLRTTKYNDGTSIPYLSDPVSETPSYSWYNNDMSSYKNSYGALYNAYAVRTGKLCPTGWDVPTITVVDALVQFLGGNDMAGGRLKQEGTAQWMPPNAGATNASKYTGLPGGYWNVAGFEGLRYYGYWWVKNYNSTTPINNDCYYLSYDTDNYSFYIDNRSRNQISVRCIKK